MRKRKIITNNREIYEKLNRLHIVPDVLLKDVKPLQITKIINNINKDIAVLNYEMIGDYILITKISPLNFDIYLKWLVSK